MGACESVTFFDNINYAQESRVVLDTGGAGAVIIEAIATSGQGGIQPAGVTVTLQDSYNPQIGFSNVVDANSVARVVSGTSKWIVYGVRRYLRMQVSAFGLNQFWSFRGTPLFYASANQGPPGAVTDAWPVVITDADATSAPLTSNDFNLVFTSPAAAGTALAGNLATLTPYRSIVLAAELRGGTGGTLDVYLQVRAATASFYDWAHFPQLGASQTLTIYLLTASRGAQSSGLTVVGSGLTPALPANTFVGGDFGDRINVVCTAGAGTSAGGLCQINIRAQP